MGWGYAVAAGIQATAQGIQGILDHNQNAKNRALQERINRQNYEAQKEFYQNSIQWRKQDAIKAGINPIYALGGTSANFTPSFTASQETAPQVAGIGTSLGNALIAYQQYKQQQQLQNKQLESMDASINKDNKQAEYYAALAEKTRGTNTETPTITATNAKTGKTIGTTNTTRQNAFTQYEQNKNEGVIDPNSQITQEQSSDGLGVIADMVFGSKARAADEGLKRMNRGEMQYPYFERDPKENGRYVLKEAHSFENWLGKLIWSKQIDYELFNFLRKMDTRHPQSEEAYQQTFIKEYLDREANTY